MLDSGNKTYNLYSVLKQFCLVRETNMGIIITIPRTRKKPTLTLLKISRKTSRESNILYSVIGKNSTK